MKTTAAQIVQALLIPSDILYGFGLSATDKLIYSFVLAVAKGKKETPLSMSMLGLVAGVSDRTISRSLAKLEKAGFLRLVEVKEGRGGGVLVRLLQRAAVVVAAAVFASAPASAAAPSIEKPAPVGVQVANNMDYTTRRRRSRPKFPTTAGVSIATRPANVHPLRPPAATPTPTPCVPQKFLPQFG